MANAEILSLSNGKLAIVSSRLDNISAGENVRIFYCDECARFHRCDDNIRGMCYVPPVYEATIVKRTNDCVSTRWKFQWIARLNKKLH